MSMDLLRFTTAGSVDDGKSTLIGRLLFDSKSIFEDQLKSVEEASIRLNRNFDLALLTDGLKAEREQGITIDVAYRYFATPKRRFIISDTPGHEQYTRNMVTGASNSDLALVLIDAKKGISIQSKRHGFITSLLAIPRMVVVVNKMDLVDYSKEVFDDICKEYGEFACKLDIKNITFIPASALLGDNVVNESINMDWYNGPTVLSHLESVYISGDRNLIDFRFPVQYVNRPNQDFRGYAGTIASGVARVGDDVCVLPANKMSKISSIIYSREEVDSAFSGQAVIICLEDEIDISRGDMITHLNNKPQISCDVEMMMVWMDEKEMNIRNPYTFRHTNSFARGLITKIDYVINPKNLHKENKFNVGLNEIARARIQFLSPLVFDEYANNPQTGSLVIIDPLTNKTVGCGMIISRGKSAKSSKNSIGKVIWLTGLSGAGKSTIATVLEQRLSKEGKRCKILDGDEIREYLTSDLGFSKEDRDENIKRVSYAAKLISDVDGVAIVAAISPYEDARKKAQELIGDDKLLMVYVKADLEVVIDRDTKGLYQRALNGEIPNFTGISDPYEEPKNADIVVDTGKMDLDSCVEAIISQMRP